MLKGMTEATLLTLSLSARPVSYPPPRRVHPSHAACVSLAAAIAGRKPQVGMSRQRCWLLREWRGH